MKAIQITQFGGPEVMKYVDLPDPVASGDLEVLDVTAIGINYADTHQTEDSYLSKQTLPLIPGMEVVGRLPNGQRVLALAAGGWARRRSPAASRSAQLPPAASCSASRVRPSLPRRPSAAP